MGWTYNRHELLLIYVGYTSRKLDVAIALGKKDSVLPSFLITIFIGKVYTGILYLEN